MDDIYIFTGLLTIAFAIAGLILTCYLERRHLEQRWLTARKSNPGKTPATELSAGGLPS